MRLRIKEIFAITSLLIVANLDSAGSTTVSSAWPQWGGPNRNFTSEVKGLANTWPTGGPRQLWNRPLGDGYSGISVEGGKLYTMYRGAAGSGDMAEPHDVVVALDAETGKTFWEHRYPAAFTPKMQMENGPGPHSTPLILANRVYTVGVMGLLHCLDTKTGKVIWSHDLYKEFNAPVRGRGYSSSPLAYKNTIILPVGGPGQAVMAFNQKDGTVAWKKQDLEWGPSS